MAETYEQNREQKFFERSRENLRKPLKWNTKASKAKGHT